MGWSVGTAASTTGWLLNQGSAASPLTVGYNCGAGTSIILALINTSATRTVSGGAKPKFDDVDMTLGVVSTGGVGNEAKSEIWYMINPPTGSSKNLIVPYTNNPINICLVISCWKHTTAGTPTLVSGSNVDTNAASGANPTSTTLTGLATDDLIIALLGSGYLSVPSASTGTLIKADDAGLYTCGSQYYITLNANDVAMTFTQSSDDWTLCTAAFRPPTAAVVVTNKFMPIMLQLNKMRNC